MVCKSVGPLIFANRTLMISEDQRRLAVPGLSFIRVIRVIRGYSHFGVQMTKSPNQTLEPTRVGARGYAARLTRSAPRGSAR